MHASFLHSLWMVAFCGVFAAGMSHAGEILSSEAALQRLLAGNTNYVIGQAAHPNQSAARRTEVAEGQKPFAIILACADSRVAPELLFDQGLGDVFVVRVAGNILDNASLGSLEYGAGHLGAPLIVVLGHEKCGAVAAAVAGGQAEGHVFSIIKAIEPVVKLARTQTGDLVENTVVGNVQRVVAQLQTAEPVLSELQKSGKLKIVGARYDLDTGLVSLVPNASLIPSVSHQTVATH